MQLRGTRVLVTGGTSGIGLELVRRLVALNCQVATCGRNPQRVASVAAEFASVLVLPVDLSLPGAAELLVGQVVEHFGGIDIVINNAAVQEHDSFVELQQTGLADRIASEVATNLTAPMQITAAFLAQLTEGQRSAVVNVTSGLALAPKKNAPVYCATKAALRTFTLAVGYQAADAGSHVLVSEALLPLVDTPMTAGRGSASKKMTPGAVADAILRGVEHDRTEIRIGAARALPAVLRLSKRIGLKILRNG
jgi:uncharacterized oxidoreductase